MTDLTQLEALARAATPGPWEHRADRGTIAVSYEPWNGVASCYGANAAYIAAANPSAILALIERVRVAEAALTEQSKRPTAEERYASIERAKRDSLNRILKAGTMP